jgi:hypothetical protein
MVNDCLRTGKKLPGHKHIATLSAGAAARVFSPKQLINHNFQVWHGGCKATRVAASLGRGKHHGEAQRFVWEDEPAS